MVEYPDSCRRLFDQVLEKLFFSEPFTEANADAAKSGYANFLQTIFFKKKRSSFQYFQVDEVGLDEFFNFFEDAFRYSALIEIFKFALILSHVQAAIERGFSANKNIRANNYNPNTVS